jgi:SsrA-binding protein
MRNSAGGGVKILAANRKARHDYEILERIEAGIELRGTEVKALRAGQASLVGGFARIQGGEVYVQNLNVPPYEYGNRFNHDPARPRRLLLRRSEIGRLRVHVEQKGHALIPLSAYLRSGLVKIDLGVCRGKRQVDRRETLRRKTADREAQRAIAERK